MSDHPLGYEDGVRWATRFTTEQEQNVLRNWKRRGHPTLALYVESIVPSPEFARGFATTLLGDTP